MPELDAADNGSPAPGRESGSANTEHEDRPNVVGKPPGEEIGGPAGPEPTRYGDWERNGRCTDF